MERRAPGSAADGSRPPVTQTQYLSPAPAARAQRPAGAGGATARAGPRTDRTRSRACPARACPHRPQRLVGRCTPVGAPAAASVPRHCIYARSDVPVQIQWYPDPASNQWMAVIHSGVNVIIDGVPGYGTIDILTDRLVIWMTAARKRPT